MIPRVTGLLKKVGFFLFLLPSIADGKFFDGIRRMFSGSCAPFVVNSLSSCEVFYAECLQQCDVVENSIVSATIVRNFCERPWKYSCCEVGKHEGAHSAQSWHAIGRGCGQAW